MSVLAAAFALTLLISASSCMKRGEAGKAADVDYYTCTMHPSVKRQSSTDKCPICAMDLVPVKKRGGPKSDEAKDAEAMGMSPDEHAKMSNGKDTERKGMKDVKGMTGMKGMPGMQKEEMKVEQPSEFTVAVSRQQQIGVTYATVEKKPLELALRAVGIVAFDRVRHWDIVTRVDGYVDKLFVASSGELVEKGQPVVTIYSPDLFTSQQEFLVALQARDAGKPSPSTAASESMDKLVEAAKTRLRLWNITDAQIEELEKDRKSNVYLTLHSPVRGLVRNLAANQGQKVVAGNRLVSVHDLSLVWVWAEFYQEELPLLRKDQPVTITSSAYPGAEFRGKIAVIDPFVNPAKRVVRVRLDIDNPDLKLRPDMYVDVAFAFGMGEGLTVPFSAVIPTGKRNVVFVDKGQGNLEPRFVELGRKFGDDFQVRSGVQEGDRVVSSANFLIDAEAKVQGALKSF